MLSPPIPNRQKTTALVVEGGAMRSVFSAGLLDGFLRRQFNPFDFFIGVSGGASNLVAFLSGQEGTSFGYYLAVAQNKQFINYRRFLLGGNLMDIDWLIQRIFSADNDHPPPSLPCQKPFYITTTDVNSGEASFIRATADNLPSVLAASMSLPLIHRQFPLVDGQPKTDGGVAANIPIAEAIQRGANRIMVVRSRPKNFIKRDTLFHRYIRHQLSLHTELVRRMAQRVELHEQAVALLQSPPEGIEVVDICPPNQFEAGRFTRNTAKLLQGYQSGLDMAETAITEWQRLV